MYAIKHIKTAALLLVLWARLAPADCTIPPSFFSAIAGQNQLSTADLDLYANLVSQCSVLDPTSTGRIRIHERLVFDDTFSTSTNTTVFAGIAIAPNFTVNANGERFSWLYGSGSLIQTVAPGVGAFQGILADTTIKSATAAVVPPIIYFAIDSLIDGCDTVACGTQTLSFGMLSGRSFNSFGAGTMTVTDHYNFDSSPQLITNNASGVITLSNNHGFYCNDVTHAGAGTETLTNDICFDMPDHVFGTNVIGVQSAISAGATKYFLKDTGGAQSSLAGKFTTYNATATAGFGLSTVVAAGRFAAQTAAKATVASFTVGGADGTFRVSANVLVTTSTVHSFTVTCAYTDEGNTPRTITLNFSTLAGVISNAGIANAGGAVPYEGVPLHIRAKSGTTITIATTGTFTTVTYNVEGLIEQLS